jgi:hypothetical protein
MKLLNKSEILSALSKHPIGRGTEATTYDAGRYDVRVPHTVKIDKAFRENLSNGIYNYQKVDNIHGRRNFGQPLYNLTDPKSGAVMLSVCKKVDGITTNDLVEEPLTTKQKFDAMAVAIEKMRIMASAPQKSYRRLVDDLNHLAGTNFTIDPCEGNMLINPTTGRFYIIDLRPVKNIRNVGDLILLLLTDIPDMPDNAEYFELEQKIVNKLMRAAQSCGLSVPEQLKLKPRALEVIKSEAARQLYKNNYQNIALHTHSK